MGGCPSVLSVMSVCHRKSDPQHNNRIFQTTVVGMMAKKHTLLSIGIFQTTVAGMKAKKTHTILKRVFSNYRCWYDGDKNDPQLFLIVF